MNNVQISVEVLGATILSKATTSGLGSIQKPLYDKYIQYRKSGKGKKSVPAWLKVSAEGITVIFPTDEPGHTQNYFYERNSINFFEGVRFTATKGGDKKYQCGFLPIDESRSLNQGYEKLFSPLEKKHHNLAKMEHPAIIACVMRRPVGVRSLDCHGFVTENDNDAYRIMNAFFSDQHTEYRHLGSDRSDEYGGRYQFRPPSESLKPDLIQTEYGPYGIYKGGKPVSLSDDHFRGNLRDSDRRSYNEEPAVADRYIGNIGRDEKKSNSKYDFEIRNERMEFEDGRARSQPIYSKINRHSAEVQHERQRSGELNREIEQNMHFRQRSGEFGGNDRLSADANIHFKQRSEEADMNRYFEGRGRIPTREEAPIRIPRPMSPLRNQGPATAPKPSRALSPEPKFTRENLRSPESPKSPRVGLRDSGREPPLSPREFPTSGPVSSVSNLESRQETKKPVAKVPPHLVAGIKVLPTGVLPKLDSPKTPRQDIIGNVENYYTNEEDPYDNAMSRKDYYNGRRNVHSEGFDGNEMRYHHETESRHYNPPPDVLPVEEKQQNDNRWRSRPESPRYQNEHQSNRNSAPVGNYGKPWSYGEQLEKFIDKEQKEKSSFNLDLEPQDSGGKMVVDRDGAKIEHDYANMFSKVNIKDNNSQLHTAGTNFESSLGYFP